MQGPVPAPVLEPALVPVPALGSVQVPAPVQEPAPESVPGNPRRRRHTQPTSPLQQTLQLGFFSSSLLTCCPAAGCSGKGNLEAA